MVKLLASSRYACIFFTFSHLGIVLLSLMSNVNIFLFPFAMFIGFKYMGLQWWSRDGDCGLFCVCVFVYICDFFF